MPQHIHEYTLRARYGSMTTEMQSHMPPPPNKHVVAGLRNTDCRAILCVSPLPHNVQWEWVATHQELCTTIGLH
jgi:hypothetical protein